MPRYEKNRKNEIFTGFNNFANGEDSGKHKIEATAKISMHAILSLLMSIKLSGIFGCRKATLEC